VGNRIKNHELKADNSTLPPHRKKPPRKRKMEARK